MLTILRTLIVFFIIIGEENEKEDIKSIVGIFYGMCFR